MEQPPGYKTGINQVCLLHKAIYGLRNSSKHWYDHCKKILINIGLSYSLSDNCLFFNDKLIIGLYVDDLIVLYKQIDLFNEFFLKISSKLNIVDKGLIENCLNINIDRHQDGSLSLNQRNYINKILVKFDLNDCKSVATPMVPGSVFNTSQKFENISLYQQLVGSLLYLANTTRPDLAFTVNLLCRQLSNPTIDHFTLAKRFLRYLKSTIDHKLFFNKSTNDLKIYVDADFANVINDNKSITGVITFFGNSPINWTSRKQKHVSTSTCEAEVNAIIESVNEAQFISELLSELNLYNGNPVIVFNDNKSLIVSILTGGNYSSNCHYRLRLGRIREAVENKLIEVRYCQTDQMKADLLTKSFNKCKLDHLCRLVSLGPDSKLF